MIKEYAVEPAVFSDTEYSVYMYKSFGLNNGRLMADLPSTWDETAGKLIDITCHGKQRKRMKARVISLKRKCSSKRRKMVWDSNKNWLENVLIEHGRIPLSAIITKKSAGSANENVVSLKDLEKDECPQWDVLDTVSVERTANKMAKCAEFFLQRAEKKIVFVDPHFDPSKRRFLRPLRKFLQTISNRPGEYSMPRLEIHLNDDLGLDFFKLNCTTKVREILRDELPEGCELGFVRWERKYLHDRFILTEFGGLSYSVGLDDHDYKSVERTKVSLLKNTFKEEWDNHQLETTSFERADAEGEDVYKVDFSI